MSLDSKLKISGFSLVRNGTRFDYPYLESLRSLLPLVDELVINIGIGDDDTISRIKHFARDEGQGKVDFFESDWQLDHLKKKRGGLILSEQTNLALQKCTSDWCIYLQADEVIHERDYNKILKSIEEARARPEIEGLLFNYHHFYGSFDVVQETRSAYRREVRTIRKSSGAQSIGDAQSFRKADGTKLSVIHSQASIYHYGWVRTPEAMREKTFFMDQLYHGDPTPEDAKAGTPHTGDNYRYKKIWGLKTFRRTHPGTMQNRIATQGWHWDLKNSPLVFSWKDLKRVFLDTIEYLTGYRFFEYRSYRLRR
jgi:hypothetical protein